MVDLSENFKKFLENIRLTENQIEDGENKCDNVCKVLHKHYYDGNNESSAKLIIGSFGKDTAIRPPSDVDVIFELPRSEKERYDNRSGNGQSQLLQDVKNVLMETYPLTDIKGDGPVVVVDFSTYKVEVNPSIKEDSMYLVPLTINGGKWEQINPIKEKDVIDESDKRSCGNTRNIIKMIKKWRDYCNVSIKSFYIEILVVDFLKETEHYDYGFFSYPMLIYEFFEYMLKQKNKINFIPGTFNIINYGDEWESKAETACKNAKNAWLNGSEDESIDYLRKILGYDFPKNV